MADVPDKNPFAGMVALKAKVEEAQPAPAATPPAHTPPPSSRDEYETSLSFRTHSDVRQKLRQDCLLLDEPMEAYMRSLCTSGLPRNVPRKSGVNKAESQVRVTFRVTQRLRRKVRQDALDRDTTVEEYLTSLVLHGRP